MKKILEILKMLGALALILGVGVLLILGFAGVSYGVQWLWSLVHFGIAGFILGVLVVSITTYFTFFTSDSKDFSFSLETINQLSVYSNIGYIAGFLVIAASVFWFFTPQTLVNTLPSFGSVIAFLLMGGLLFVGVLGCLAEAIQSFRYSIWSSLFMLGVSLFGLFVINAPLWSVTEEIPNNYYIVGKVGFLFLLFIQILSLTFFCIIPNLQNGRQREEKDFQK